MDTANNREEEEEDCLEDLTSQIWYTGHVEASLLACEFLLSLMCMMGGGSVLKYGCFRESCAEIRSAGTPFNIFWTRSSVL